MYILSLSEARIATNVFYDADVDSKRQFLQKSISCTILWRQDSKAPRLFFNAAWNCAWQLSVIQTAWWKAARQSIYILGMLLLLDIWQTCVCWLYINTISSG